MEGDDSAFDLTGFDRYVEEHEIPEEDYPPAFALWLAERAAAPMQQVENAEEAEDG